MQTSKKITKRSKENPGESIKRRNQLMILTVVLDSTKLKNPDSDLRYAVSERIEEKTASRIIHDGYEILGKGISSSVRFSQAPSGTGRRC